MKQKLTIATTAETRTRLGIDYAVIATSAAAGLIALLYLIVF